MKYALLSIALLVLVAACAQFKTPTAAVSLPSADEALLEGTEETPATDCFMLKHNRVNGIYNCFGCSNGNCKDADANWGPLGSDTPRVQCLASPRGCVLA
ncbi:hypothetical protein HY484_00145 [Candidatus Woesearchaeota archaeon]|nr:hypothetical protein [Candidatus Woesearchaeota archaeon]